MMKKPSIRRTKTLEVSTDSDDDISTPRGLSSPWRISSVHSSSSSASKRSLTKSLTKADQIILTGASRKSLPPRKSTSVYSKYSINKNASNSTLKSQKSNASIASRPSLKGQKSKSLKPTKKTSAKARPAKKRAPASGKKTKTKAAAEPKREIFYLRAEFVALKAEDEDFYLAQVCQHVYNDTEVFRIRWLERSARRNKVEGEYVISYVDETEPECIITHVRMIRVRRVKGDENEYYRLPESEERKIIRNLNADSDSEEEDEEEEDEEEEDDEEEEEEEEESDDEPPAKKRKTAKGKKKKVVSTKAKKEKKPKKKKEEKPKKRKLTPEERENPNLLLQKNDRVKVLDKDPFLEGKDKVPFISTNAHAKLLHRAVVSRDAKLLRSLVADLDNIYSVSSMYSVLYRHTPLGIAVRNNDVESIKILVKELQIDQGNRKKPRVEATKSLMSMTGTGRYNYRSLGVPRIQKLTMSRGSKEGNNALLKDVNSHEGGFDMNNALETAIKYGLPRTTLDSIIAAGVSKKSDRDSENQNSFNSIVGAVKNGHRKIAGQLVDDCMKHGDTGQFNFLHRDVLLFKNEDLKSFREASCKKKPWSNDGMTPIHCAAINPNVKYLSKLLSVLPEYNLLDRTNARPIHYAAACEGTGPLEFLLKKGVDPEEMDGKGMTALMIACKTGRAHNVKLLMDKAKEEFNKMQGDGSENEGSDGEEEEEEEDGDAAKQAKITKYGIGGINRPVQKPGEFYAFCAIHFAISFHHMNVVEELIKQGVNLHKTLHNARNKESPLMMACYHGSLDMVKLLIKNKAKVEEKDRLSRTPLIYACMNGRAQIASYLLHLGADPNAADSSGNTCMHYAAAYGWYHCIKVLLEAGADANRPNQWKTTPMWIAFLKGHLGLMDILLDQPNADVNVQDEEGMTLLAIACSSPLVKGLDQQIKYLVEKRNADPNVLDDKGNNCLHHLAENKVCLADEKSNEEAAKLSESLTNYLIKKGCSPAAVNKDGASPLFIAIWKDNIKMVKILINHTTVLPVTQAKNGNNLLHNMAMSCMTSDQKAIIDLLLGRVSFHGQLQKMAQDVNDRGYTPLLEACHIYNNTKKNQLTALVNDKNPSDGDGDQEEEEDEESYASDEDEDEDDAAERKKEKEKKKNAAKKGTATDSSEDADLEWTKEQQRMKDARDFIDTLISRCGSNVDETVQKYKVEDDVDTSTWKEVDFYKVKDHAGWTPLFYMLAAEAEDPIKRKDGSVVEMCPGLAMILNHNPDINKVDLNYLTPLIVAIVKAGWSHTIITAAVKMLVENGADMDYEVVIPEEKVKDVPAVYLGCCAINMAARVGNVETTVYLAERGADLFIRTRDDNATVLHEAVTQSRAECNVLPMVKALVEKGAKINDGNSYGSTPLHTSLCNGNQGSDGTAEVEAYLIDHGANLQVKDNFGRLPLHNVFAKVGRPFDASRDDPIDLCTTVVAAMRPDKINEKDQYGATALHYAARRGAGVCCMTLIQKGADTNVKDGDGNTPLGLATLSVHESCAILLLQRNADFSQPMRSLPDEEIKERNGKELKVVKGVLGDDDKIDLPAMQWYIFKKQAEKKRKPQEMSTFLGCVSREWQGLVFMMLNELDNFNFSPAEALHAAIHAEKFNLALAFLRKIKEKKKFSALLTNSRTLFHVFALKADPGTQEDLQLRLAENLCDVGVPLNRKDRFGCLPLHYACLRRNNALVKFILGKVTSANIFERDNNRRTPFIAAVFGECVTPMEEGVDPGFKEIVGELMKYGAKMEDKFAYDPPEYCTFGFKAEIDRKTIDEEYCKPALNEVTSLIMPITFENFHLAKYLLENKADVNGADKYGKTAMMYAVGTSDHHLVRLLLDAKYSKEDTKKKTRDEESEEEEDEDEEDEEEENDDDGSDYDPESDDDVSPRKRKKGGKPPKGASAGGRAPRAQLQPKKLSRRVFAFGDIGDDEDDADGDVSSAKRKSDRNSLQNGPGLPYWKDFIPTKKSSKVNLNAADSSGRTALHHLKGPLRLGSFENMDILKLLVDNGADVNRRDNNNNLPIECFIANGASNLFKGMKSYMAGARFPAFLLDMDEITDEINWTTPPPDFRTDAAAMLRKVDERKTDKKKAEVKKFKPDQVLEVKEGEVVEDSDLEVPYDVMLMKIDVNKGCYCLYNFYKLQLVFDKKKKLYVMLNKWGRIGDDGQYQQTPFGTLEEAVKEYTKIFKSKTANKWTDIKSFVTHPNKYRLIPLEQRLQKDQEYNAIDFDLSSNQPSEIPQELSDLMKEISDVEGLKVALEHNEFNVHSTPFGRISRDFLQQAKDILEKLEPFVKKWEDNSSPSADQKDEYHEAAEQISELTNEYHYLVPSKEFAFEKVSPLRNFDALNQAKKRVDNLAELELAGRILAAAQFRKKEINPMDYIYRTLDCQLRSLDENGGDGLVQYLLQYIHIGYSRDKTNFAVERIFEVARDGELERYNGCKMENQKLLFHGTKSSNLLGILSRGLLVTPIEAYWTGRSFGNGIYFSDSFEKSFAYSHSFNSKSKKRFVLICQVKLGKTKKCGRYEDNEVEKKHDSLMATGNQQSDPKYDVTLPNGVVIPLGKPPTKDPRGYGYVSDSEFIIPTEEQVCIKYLIQLRQC